MRFQNEAIVSDDAIRIVQLVHDSTVNLDYILVTLISISRENVVGAALINFPLFSSKRRLQDLKKIYSTLVHRNYDWLLLCFNEIEC